jgi:DNA repair protein RecO (recombination protein O)
MLHKTKGIVLHAQPYNDAYSIIHVFTEVMGKAAFISSHAKNSRNHKGRPARKIFSPLSLHELEIECKDGRDIHRIRESQLILPLHGIHSSPLKSTVALFLSEFIYRLIKEGQPDMPMFDYLFRSITMLDAVEEGTANFHLTFLIGLLHYTGLAPQAAGYRPGSYFDMRNGVFIPALPLHDDYLDLRESATLYSLLRIRYGNMSLYAFSRRERSLILNKIIWYYRIHLPHIPELKSLPVLQAVFD